MSNLYIILKTENLSKDYKNIKVLNDISLEIPKWAIYGLLGPNWAGKSTFMKIISGIIKNHLEI